MYQVNIPMIYYELERRNLKRMSSVLVKGSVGAVATYCIIGVFGYLIFVDMPGMLIKQNILHTNYEPFDENPAILLVRLRLLTGYRVTLRCSLLSWQLHRYACCLQRMLWKSYSGKKRE